MAVQVKIHYDNDRFATFLLEDLSFESLLLNIKKYCSTLAHLDRDTIRLRYKDEDGDFVNINPDDPFALSEMLRSAKKIDDRDYKKITVKAHEINSPLPLKIRKLDSETRSSGSAGILHPKTLQFPTATSTSTSASSSVSIQHKSPLDAKGNDLEDSITVLKVQLSSAKEEMDKLKEQDKLFLSLSGVRSRLCTVCHVSGHTKTTCQNEPCTQITFCKIREKHPEHRAKIQGLQREIKNLEQQVTEQTANFKTFMSARERAKTSFFAVMRPRLQAQNLTKYGTGSRLQLDRDLLVLQRALNNKVPEWGQAEDWKLPLVLEQFQNSHLKDNFSYHGH